MKDLPHFHTLPCPQLRQLFLQDLKVQPEPAADCQACCMTAKASQHSACNTVTLGMRMQPLQP
jgi:hypothetical protein